MVLKPDRDDSLKQGDTSVQAAMWSGEICLCHVWIIKRFDFGQRIKNIH